MAKYSFEFKKKVVLEYLDGKGEHYIFQKNMDWVLTHSYAHGLMRSRKQTKYPFKKKIFVVELYLQARFHIKIWRFKKAYQMKAYSHRLHEERIFQSISRKGNCRDNAVMENFFGLLKQEIYYGVVYYSYEELKLEIKRYIKYYNEQRIKV